MRLGVLVGSLLTASVITAETLYFNPTLWVTGIQLRGIMEAAQVGRTESQDVAVTKTAQRDIDTSERHLALALQGEAAPHHQQHGHVRSRGQEQEWHQGQYCCCMSQ